MLACWVETIDCYKRILRKSFDLLKHKHDKNIGNKIKPRFRHFFFFFLKKKKKNPKKIVPPIFSSYLWSYFFHTSGS